MVFFRKIYFRLIVISFLVSLPIAGFLACTGPSKIESPGEDKPGKDKPDEEFTPPISLPAPPLPLIKNEKILIATMDSESRNPVIAFPGAIDVSEMNDADGNGYVDNIRMAVALETPEETDLASLHSCPIKTDGSAECYPVGDNGTTYCVYLTDGTNKLTKPFCEDPNVNVVWNGKPVRDIVKGPDHPYLGSVYHILTDTHIATMTKTNDPEDPAMIWGDFADDYKHANVRERTKEIAFDPGSSILANRIPEEGLPLFTSEYDAGSLEGTFLEGLDILLMDTGEIRTERGYLKYKKLKLTDDNKLRFGIEALILDVW